MIKADDSSNLNSKPDSITKKFIILRKIKYGESDLILHAMSGEGGKYSFLAKGALKSKKRFGGGILEPINYVQFTYREPRRLGELGLLQEARLLKDFDGIKKSYDHLELALHVLDCVAKVCQEGDETSDFLFNLTGHALKAIEESKNLPLLKLHFYLKLLYQQGVISPESWMAIFLRTKLTEIDEAAVAPEIVTDYLPSIETLVFQYVRTADAQ